MEVPGKFMGRAFGGLLMGRESPKWALRQNPQKLNSFCDGQAVLTPQFFAHMS